MQELSYDVNAPFPSLDILYKYRLANTADKSILGLKVTFPPSAQTPPHTHHGASVAVTVLTGSVYDKMNDDPMTVKKVGDSIYEAPGCRHRISANTSDKEEASILAVFVLETEKMDSLIEAQGPMGLVLVDEEWQGAVAEQMKQLMGGQ